MDFTPGSYVRIVADNSQHGLPLRSVHAVERVVMHEEGPYLMVSGRAVEPDDVEPFDLEPAIVNGRPVTPNATAESVIGDDGEFAATMASLSALFAGPTQSLQEPILDLAGDTLPAGAPPSLPGRDEALSGADGPVNEVRSQPFTAAHGVEPEPGQAYHPDFDDSLAYTDMDGDPLAIRYRAKICPSHGVEGLVFFATNGDGAALPIGEIPALIRALTAFYVKNDARIRNRRTNGK